MEQEQSERLLRSLTPSEWSEWFYRPNALTVALMDQVLSLKKSHLLVGLHIRTNALGDAMTGRSTKDTVADIQKFFDCLVDYQRQQKDLKPLGVLFTDNSHLKSIAKKQRHTEAFPCVTTEGEIAHVLYTTNGTSVRRAFADFFLLSRMDAAIITTGSTFSHMAMVLGGLKAQRTIGRGGYAEIGAQTANPKLVCNVLDKSKKFKVELSKDQLQVAEDWSFKYSKLFASLARK